LLGKKIMTDIYLCVDPGGSQTKIIYQLGIDGKPKFIVMPPEIEQISKSKLESYQSSMGWIGNPSPRQQAWLEVNNGVFVVGAMASKFDPCDRLGEVKYENAIYKVLTAIGLIVAENQLANKKPLMLQLAILLPWNEYNDRKRFRTKLESLLLEYSFRGQTIKVKLKKTICRPEGGGLAAIRIRQKGIDWLQQQKLGVLMLGHRNVTALYFDGGELVSGDSPILGFSKMLDKVVDLTSGLERNKIADAIFAGLNALIVEDKNLSYEQRRVYKIAQKGCIGCYGYTVHPNWKELPSIQSLATAKDTFLRASEIADLANGIHSATEQYWLSLSKWLARTFPSDLDEVVISGGAARFLEPELEKYFNCEPVLKDVSERVGKRCIERIGYYSKHDEKRHFTPIVWSAEISEQVSKIFKLGKLTDLGVQFRLVDAYGLFDYMIAKDEK
jgi:hypothetical protein